MTSNQVQIRRDSATNLNAATPSLGEIGYDTTNKRLRAGDGTTAGGVLLPNSIDVQGQNFISSAATGTDTITITVSPVPTTYATYQRFVFKAAADNTGSATLNVNSLGAKTLKKRTSSGISDLSSGDIQQDGIYAVVYDGTYFQLDDHTASAATSDYVFLAKATASASGSLNFTSLITSTYDSYQFVCKNLRPATDDVVFWMRTSTDNGSTYTSSLNSYQSVTSADTTAIGIAGSTTANDGVGNGAAEGVVSCIIDLVNPLNSTMQKSVFVMTSFIKADATRGDAIATGWRLSTADIDAVRFMFSSGNITSGEISMYGRITT